VKDEVEQVALTTQSAAHESHRIVVERLSAEYMVPIRRGILSIFMLRDGEHL
jgi:hypothetical protein